MRTKLTAPGRGVVLDTCVLIDLLRAHPAVQAGVDRLLGGGCVIATSAACVAELYGGMRIGEETITHGLVSILDCLPLTLEIAKRAGDLKAERSRVGRTHGIVDMMIAATALEYNYPVATNNRRDFEIPGLDVIVLP